VATNQDIVRFALSLGMLLGLSHGWVVSESRASENTDGIGFVKTVKSATGFNPFGSNSHQSFPY
jgi:hypothetical protein